MKTSNLAFNLLKNTKKLSVFIELFCCLNKFLTLLVSLVLVQTKNVDTIARHYYFS